MKNDIFEDVSLIEKYKSEMQGVFCISDLKALFPSENKATFFNRITRIENKGILKRFSRGIYLTENFNIARVLSNIAPDAYISMGNVLAKNALIGSIPGREVYAVKTGRNREYNDSDYSIKVFSISEKLYFGFTKIDGILWADNEKAVIDTLYYYMKGQRYFFDPASDIDFSRLNKKKISKYLSFYQNKRFVSFCRSIING
jgi:predicted transcriptional regulator of viral defense system